MPKREQIPFDMYLQTVLAQLSMLTPAERAVIQAELEAHLADAARDCGVPADDPALQARVITALGSGKDLGKAWAQVYAPVESSMRTSSKVLFLGLWVVANIVGWVAVAPGFYNDTSLWRFPLNAVVASVLQALLLRSVAGVQWWWRWLVAGLIPWLILAGVYATVPWAMLTEPQWEGIFLSSLLLLSVVIGVLQWRVLRGQVRTAWVWVGVPLVSLVTAMMLSISLNVTLVASPAVIARLGGWQGMVMLLGVVFGATYGLVTGSILHVLMRIRQSRLLNVKPLCRRLAS